MLVTGPTASAALTACLVTIVFTIFCRNRIYAWPTL